MNILDKTISVKIRFLLYFILIAIAFAGVVFATSGFLREEMREVRPKFTIYDDERASFVRSDDLLILESTGEIGRSQTSWTNYLSWEGHDSGQDNYFSADLYQIQPSDEVSGWFVPDDICDINAFFENQRIGKYNAFPQFNTTCRKIASNDDYTLYAAESSSLKDSSIYMGMIQQTPFVMEWKHPIHEVISKTRIHNLERSIIDFLDNAAPASEKHTTALEPARYRR